MYIEKMEEQMGESGIKWRQQVLIIKVARSWFAGAARGRGVHKVHAPSLDVEDGSRWVRSQIDV